jgi:amino acid adenylation domain-containing protein
VSDGDRSRTISSVLAGAAAAEPDRAAFSLLGNSLTYRELDASANRFARFLVDSGVRPGDRVGLHAHKSLELYVAMFGAMRAGAAFVPVNPDAPPAYVRHIVEDCEIRVLVVGRSTHRSVVALGGDSPVEVCVGVDVSPQPRSVQWAEIADLPPVPPDVDVSADDLAYVIFTSGSTGRPKGIMHTHRSGLAYGDAASAAFGFVAADRITNHAPLNFDLSLFELWGGLVAAATVIVVPEAHARLPASFSQLLDDEAVTVVNAVPYALAQLVHRGALEERDLSTIRLVAFGGEVFATKDLRALMERLPGARFVNVYGPAEVNGVTFLEVPDLAPDRTDPISVGRLYDGMRALVVDEDDVEVAPGEVGELLIHSPTHMVGYWRQPELTAAATHLRITPDGAEERWHRTGDLVRRDEHGEFHLVGRKDRMVKTRGHRVELDEVEAALMSHDAVKEAVVFTVPDGEGSIRIEAVLTLHESPDSAPDESALRRHAAATLPRYAVPRDLRIVAEVPRTSTGKADRVALTRTVRGSPPT